MTLKEHLVSAAPLSLVVGLASGSAGAGLAAGLTTVLVDADHVLDYVVSNGRFEGLGHMIDYSYRGRIRRLFLVGHSYELFFLALVLLPQWLPLIWALAILSGWACHLALDQLFNTCQPGSYFFVYRLKKGFLREAITTPGRNLYTSLAFRLNLPQRPWTRPRDKKR
ncbi:MAG: hypothetical protein JRJ59_01625 [Deltaproteobacteria bacterium]|nr:hypothetical protein [Deltaproteobacteria bacterium]